MNKESIKVVTVAHTIKGGAGIAAKRLHDGLLLDMSINETMFVKEKPHTQYNKVLFDTVNKTDNLIADFILSKNTRTYFTITPSYAPLKEYDFLLDFDIINIHWIDNYLPNEAIAYLSHSGKPIVWTFHDKSPLTAGCHYFHNCINWKDGCIDCSQLIDNYNNFPAKIFASKKKYINFENITVVVLNEEFKKLVEASQLFNGSRIEVIPNSIDIETFAPINKIQIRKKLGLDINKKYLLYTAANGGILKGYKEFEQSIALFANKYDPKDIEILLAGNLPKYQNIKLPYREFGYVDENDLIELYNASDVTIISSIEDNLPNIILESLSCGTPVVGFKVGGLPDIIQDNYTGYTVELGDITGLAASIHKVLVGEELSQNCRTYAEKNLRLEVQAKRYKALYEELLAKPVKETGKQKLIPEVFPETALGIITILNKAAKARENSSNKTKIYIEEDEDNDSIKFHVRTLFFNVQIAFYLFKDGKRVDVQWYSDKHVYILNKNRFGNGKYKIQYFLVDKKEKDPGSVEKLDMGLSKEYVFKN